MKANYNFKLEIKDFYWKNMNNEESKNHSYLEFLRFNLYFFLYYTCIEFYLGVDKNGSNIRGFYSI